MHPVVSEIRKLLDDAEIPYEYMEHKSGRSSEEMVAIRGDKYTLEQGTKALIVKTDIGFVQVVVPGDKRFSNKKLRKVLQVKGIAFATPEELSDITNGVLPGAVPPFGTLFNLPVYVDTGVFDNETIVFSCGERTASIAMPSSAYKRLVNPTILDLAQG